MRKFSSTMRATSRRTLLNRRLRLTAMLGLFLALLIFLLPIVFRTVVSVVMVPVVMTQDWIAHSESTIPQYLRTREALLGDLAAAREELLVHETAITTNARLTAENERLLALLGGATTTERIAATVVGNPALVPHDVLVIDKGQNANIKVGAPVYMAADTIIGFVSAVTKTTSIVVPATAPGIETTVYVLGPNIYTTAVGQGGGVLEVGVPQGINIALDDTVIAPTLGMGVFGSVVAIDSVPSRPEQYAYVTLPRPLQNVRVVTVGTAPAETMSFEDARAVVDAVREELFTVPVPEGVLIDITDATSTATTTPAATSTATSS